MSKLKTSVAMCTYNGARYVIEQLQSIEQQTYLPDEVIICDDCSQDDTVSLIQTYAKSSKLAIKLFQNQTNLGYKQNFAQSFKLADGDIIFFSDQDDVWHPSKIERCVNAFAHNPRLGMAIVNANVVDQSLQPFGQMVTDLHGFDQSLPHMFAPVPNYEFVLSRGYPIFYGFLMAVHRSLKEVILPIPEDYPHDRWAGTIAAAISDVLFLPEPLAEYRQHNHQTSGNKKAKGLQKLRGRLQYMQTLRNPYFYKNILKEDIEIRDRLLQVEPSQLNPGVMEHLDSKITHLESRLKMRQRLFFLRPPLILKEITSGRYAKFARSWKTVFVDLLL